MIGLALVVAVAVALMVHRFVERPITRYAKFWAQR
jgi:peptidoglycan/LPS O-acetylase OafA/YrhL